MEAEIYSKTNCGYCDRAKLRLAKYNPKIYMLDKDYTREDFFEKFPNAKTCLLYTSPSPRDTA